MDVVLMAGGEGSRFGTGCEKPLFRIADEPMVERVLAALDASDAGTIHAAVSANASATRAHLERTDGVYTIETPGEGYVADLGTVLDRPSIEPPVLTVATDLPLLSGDVIDRILDVHDGRSSMTVCVPVSLKRRLGASVDARLPSADHLAPTGVNVVGDTDRSMRHVCTDERLAINVNRREDATCAERYLEDRCD